MEKKINGFLLIDKPEGMTSFDVIRQLRRQTGIRTFGHAGTLDPFATGLLIIAVNKYTRLLPLLDDADKTYEVEMQFGTATTTADPEGEVIAYDKTPVSYRDIAALIDDIYAITELSPPKYSALKVDGKRAYDLARQGKEFELPARAMTVLDFDLLGFEYPYLKYSCRVSKGTYIRALSEWIAAKLHTVAYTTALRRTAINHLNATDAIAPEAVNAENMANLPISITEVCPYLSKVELNKEELAKLRQGNPVFNHGRDEATILVLFDLGSLDDTDDNFEQELEACEDEDYCYGIAYRKDNYLYPKVNL